MILSTEQNYFFLALSLKLNFHVKTTLSLFHMLLSCVLTSSQTFPTMFRLREICHLIQANVSLSLLSLTFRVTAVRTGGRKVSKQDYMLCGTGRLSFGFIRMSEGGAALFCFVSTPAQRDKSLKV